MRLRGVLKPKTSPNHWPAVRMRGNLCQPPRLRCRWRWLVARDERAEVLHKRIEFAWPMCALLPMDSDELWARNALDVRPPIVALGDLI